MEMTKVEFVAIEQVALAAEKIDAIRELADLELALVGGGAAEVHFG